MRTDWSRKMISSLYSFVICQIFIGLFKKMVTKFKKNLCMGLSEKFLSFYKEIMDGQHFLFYIILLY